MNIVLAQTKKEGKKWVKENPLEGDHFIVTPKTVESCRGITGTNFFLAGNLRMNLKVIKTVSECFTHLGQENPVHRILPVLAMLDQISPE